MNTDKGLTQAITGQIGDEVYEDFLNRFLLRFRTNTAGLPLFTTDAGDLFTAYLNAMPEDMRHVNTCHACRDFFRVYAGLVTIDAEGRTWSAMWNEDDAPPAYKPAVATVERIVRRARVTGIFLSSEMLWGKPVTGDWHHLAIVPGAERQFAEPLRTASQKMAELREDHNTLARALSEFSQEILTTALHLCKSETLYRSEKCQGVAEWLLGLKTCCANLGGDRAANLLWLATATAPPGYCHPRSTMIGTLLEDLRTGLPFGIVKQRFDEKMKPTQYQRPQAPPSSGNIALAEKVVERLGIKESLKRRYARLGELRTLWRPVELKPAGGEGVFAHLVPKEQAPKSQLKQPEITMTWEKFARTVLPEAQAISFYVPAGANSYTALVTASDPEAPPILQWDLPERRNPLSWYLYSKGSFPTEWGLKSGDFQKVNAVSLLPCMWAGDGSQYAHFGKGVVFVLDGMRDQHSKSGLALFPEILKSHLREVRATIEAFSNSGTMDGLESSSACGILLQAGQPWRGRFRVMTNGIETDYVLDRWD